MANRLEESRRGQASGNGQKPPMHDDWLAEHCPLTHAQMTTTTIDGKPRKQATLMVLFDENDGRAKACLNDRDAGFGCWVTLESLSGVFEAIEDDLGSETPNWRKSKPRTQFNRPGAR